MAVYLVRHGETDWNIEKRFQGQRDIPLNERGRAQARASGQALAGVTFAAVFASPLHRARQTAQIIAGYTGGAPVVTDDRLIERSFGALEGMTLPEGQAYLASHGGTGGQETKLSAGSRMEDFLAWAAERYPEEDILVVSHGSIICCTLSLITNDRLALSGYDIPNGGISRLRRQKDGWKVELYGVAPENFRPDLPDMPFPAVRQPEENLV